MSKPEGYPFIGEPTGLKVIIVGAGLGGLACAIECRRKGHQVIVFENAPEIMRIGDTLVTPHPYPSISLPPSYHSPILILAHFEGNRSECGETHLPLGNPRLNRPIIRSHGPFQDFPE
jgi:choline dehydrogenase-like flavoprotein